MCSRRESWRESRGRSLYVIGPPAVKTGAVVHIGAVRLYLDMHGLIFETNV